MAEKEEIATKEENKAAEQQPVEKKKGNKTIMMMGIVILISVGCAFVFVSKVYPSLSGNAVPDALAPENPENEAAPETAEAQTVIQPETKKEPVSTPKKKEEKGKDGQEGAEMEESLIVPVDTIVVNLSGSNGRRYLKAKINLEAKDGDVKKTIEAKAIQIKDRLISIISSKTLEDIDGLEAQENLRKEIKDAVDVVLKVEGVLQVYFTEFVVQ
jgi:flagellar basal body-associated protein FliL